MGQSSIKKFLWLFFFALIGCSLPKLIREDRENYGYFYDHFKDIDQIKSAMENKNFDINALHGTDDFKATLLHWAAYNDDLEMVKFLVKSGAKLDVRDDLYGIPLSETTSSEIAEFFIQKGIDIDEGSYHHCHTALHIAVYRCDVEMVKFCLSHGADPNRELCHAPAETPLWLAFDGMKKLQRTDWPREKLFRKKAKPSLKGYIEIIKLLVENRADVNKTCEWGEFSPMKAAIALGDKEIIDLLRKHGAK